MCVKFEGIIFKEGKLKNGFLEKNRPLWLRVEHRNKKLILYISFDGKSFNKIAQANDNTFREGELGILNGSPLLLIDEVDFSQ